MYKELIKYFYLIFKNAYWILSEKQRKALKRSSWKVSNSFWGRKKLGKKYGWKQYKTISEEEKRKEASIWT